MHDCAGGGDGGRLATTARRVLLVDDIAMNRDVVGAFLRSSGHEGGSRKTVRTGSGSRRNRASMSY